MGEEKKYAAKCPHCATRLRVRQQDLGSQRTCPKCKQVFAVPNPGGMTDSESGIPSNDAWTPPVQHAVVCRLCKTRYFAAENQVGETLPCPDCHTDNKVVAPTPSKASLSPRDPLSTTGIGFDNTLPRNLAADQFRVICKICDSVLYCVPKDIGKKIRCSDCGTVFQVPSPPPKKAKSTIKLEDPGINVRPEAEIPMVKSNAEAVLKRATDKYHEIESKKQKPPERPFRDKLWTLPFQLEVLPAFLAISLLACFVVFLGAMALESKGGFDTLFGMGIMAAAGVLTITMTLMATNTLMAISVSASMGHTKIDFPKFELFGYVMTAVLVVNAIAVTYGPGISIGLIVGVPWVSLVALPVAFFGFPIVYLSMLDASSAAVPYTRYIGSTLKDHRSDWIRFYLVSLIAFALMTLPHGVGLLLMQLGMTISPEFRAGLFVMAVLMSVYGVLVYFCLIGRLVWVIDQADGNATADVPVSEAPESAEMASAS